MKAMTRFAAGIAVALGSATALTAQEWSAAQKEVWSQVEAYSQAFAMEDLEGFMAYFDDDFLGWDIRGALPRTKSDVRRRVAYFFETKEVVQYAVKPVGIKIHGDIAFVHYYYSRILRGKDGTDTEEKGRWTDILKKQGPRWVQIGDHGGAHPGG